MNIQNLLVVPPPLRARVMALLEVGLRILHYDEPVEDASHVNLLFDKFPALRDALSADIWYEADGKTLKEDFQQQTKKPQKAKAATKKQ